MTRNHSGDSVASTLHRVWTGTIVKLLVLMAGIGTVAIGATLYVRDLRGKGQISIAERGSVFPTCFDHRLKLSVPVCRVSRGGQVLSAHFPSRVTYRLNSR